MVWSWGSVGDFSADPHVLKILENQEGSDR